MEIIHKGISRGDWEINNLPKLAKHLGVSVDELVDESNKVAAKSKSAARLGAEFRRRLGPQSKISAVTANVAAIGLMTSLAVLKGLKSTPQYEKIERDLNLIFPDADGEAVPQLMEMIGRYMSGDIKTPVTAHGLERSIAMADFCGNEAYAILMDGAAKAAASVDVEDNTDPVTG